MNWLTTSGVWTILTSSDLWAGTLREATPLTLAAVGGVMCERSGVVNIALEGIMLTGAFFAIVFDVLAANALVGLLAGVVAGALMALILAVCAIHLKSNQIVIGMAINLVALGVTSYLNFTKYPGGTPPACVGKCQSGNVYTIGDWPIPGLDRLPAVGQILFHQNPIVYFMVLVVILAHLFLFRTTPGLRLRAVGEHPRAADTAGINVQGIRYYAVIVSGCLSGLAGGYLALAISLNFSDNMTSGRGFIALAAMIFGKWLPYGAFGACLLFGFGAALYAQLENFGGPLQNYSPLIATLPYLLTLVALAGFIGKASAPAADGIPYDPASAG